MAQPLFQKEMHPTTICTGFLKAMDDALEILDQCAFPLDVNNREEVAKLVNSCIGTKFISRWGQMMCDLALDAVETVFTDEMGRKEIDIKRYAKVEKVLRMSAFGIYSHQLFPLSNIDQPSISCFAVMTNWY